jgi:hypothetical protein
VICQQGPLTLRRLLQAYTVHPLPEQIACGCSIALTAWPCTNAAHKRRAGLRAPLSILLSPPLLLLRPVNTAAAAAVAAVREPLHSRDIPAGPVHRTPDDDVRLWRYLDAALVSCLLSRRCSRAALCDIAKARNFASCLSQVRAAIP